MGNCKIGGRWEGMGCNLYDMVYLGIGQALIPAFVCALRDFHINLWHLLRPAPAIIQYEQASMPYLVTVDIHDLAVHW